MIFLARPKKFLKSVVFSGKWELSAMKEPQVFTPAIRFDTVLYVPVFWVLVGLCAFLFSEPFRVKNV